MKKLILVKHFKGAPCLRIFGLGPKLIPCNGLNKLKNFLDINTTWARDRSLKQLRQCLANSDVIVSIWQGREILGFGRAISDGIYRGVLWDIVIDQNHQGKGYGTIIINSILQDRKIKKTEKIYLMTTNKKNFYSQFNFKEVKTQDLLLREIS